MIWKVSYDFARPFWIAFGRVAFVKGDTQEAAKRRAERFVMLREPGATVRRLDLTESHWTARMAYWRRVQANRQWVATIKTGQPQVVKL